MKILISVILMILATNVSAKDSFYTTCNWSTIKHLKYFNSGSAIPSGCMDKERFLKFKEVKPSRNISIYIASATPPICPEGYKDFGVIMGSKIDAHINTRFEARRLCISD